MMSGARDRGGWRMQVMRLLLLPGPGGRFGEVDEGECGCGGLQDIGDQVGNLFSWAKTEYLFSCSPPFPQLDNLLECAAQEPIEDIDLPQGARFDLYTQRL